MPRKRSDNKITEIAPEFGSVLVCNKKQLRPFIEIIVEEPENISHQNLGTLIGVLEITDTSEDSSYVVNYLISVIKKEYFSKAKRGPIESLEAALHKANLALANLAEHKNINWLGKLNALVAVTEKNNLHLSQTGTASAFLMRAQTLTDISEGLSPSGTDPYPLKTFVSVSSGRLEDQDKIIITTANIFDIFSLEEIKKSALRFSNEEFIQFLRTALGNELERSAVLIADMKIQQKALPEKSRAYQKEVNAFSKDAFTEPPRRSKPGEIEKSIQKEIQENPREFVDEKTGHIYIKEGYETIESPRIKTDYAKIATDKSMRLLSLIPSTLKKIPRPNIKNIRLPQIPQLQLHPEKIKDGSRRAFEKIHAHLKNYSKKISFPAKRKTPESSSDNQKIFLQKTTNIASVSLGKILEKAASFSKLIIPSYARIRNSFSAMEYQQKIYIILALVLIFIAPIFIIKIQDSLQNEGTSLSEPVNVPATIPLEKDMNVVRIENLSTLFSANNVQEIISLKGQVFAITQTDIIAIQENKSFPIPQKFQSPSRITQMNDLNLIFLMNAQNEITSFSPISKKFSDNILDVPAGSKISAIGTYLTYIYLADQKNNQIYRYPRTEGGFGEKIDWLKDTISFSDMNDMAISENIFISSDSSIIKLFRGKNQNFTIPETATPIRITKLSLGEKTGNLFILDKQNSRIIHLDSENRIKNQYYHPEINSATDLAVDEETNTLYLAAEKEIKTILLSQ